MLGLRQVVGNGAQDSGQTWVSRPCRRHQPHDPVLRVALQGEGNTWGPHSRGGEATAELRWWLSVLPQH